MNMLHSLKGELHGTAGRFVAWCQSQLGIAPASDDFTAEFVEIVAAQIP